MLPISVLVPTRNSMSLLPQHIEGMREWMDLALEIVVVDSHSTDGTAECLQREVKHPHLRVLTHPPGLYQSWNYGIAECAAPYVYISTVGERITREGLEKLVKAAVTLDADIVISPPQMVDMAGGTVEKTWPIHALLEQRKLDGPAMMSGAAAQLFAITHLLRGILGSSASNLYNAKVLQRFPFRTDFGTAGDLAWGLEHAGETRWAVVPESLSTFVFHPKAYAKSDYAVTDFAGKCLGLGRESLRRAAWPKEQDAAGSAILMEQLLGAWETYLACKRTVAAAKKSPIWWLSPGAWASHRRRAESLRTLEVLQHQAMDRMLIAAG